MTKQTVNYDETSDTLYVSFEPGVEATGIELNDHILLRIDKINRKAIGITFFEYSLLAQKADFGPRSFPLPGLSNLPVELRELVVAIMLTSPVADLLSISTYTPLNYRNHPNYIIATHVGKSGIKVRLDSPIVTSSISPFPVDRGAVALPRNGICHLSFPHQSLGIFAKTNEGRLIGGLLGDSNWEWMCISYLWLDENSRGQGLGTQLLKAAEVEAHARGCHHILVDTMSFQALPFYQKHGYEIWGTLDDFPTGFKRHFLKKVL